MTDYIDIKKLLGRRIKELRLHSGLTQEKLAELIGLGERNLSKIECGNNFVTSETLSKILAALNVEPYELFNFKHLDDINILKSELVDAINNEKIDIKKLYQFYMTIK